LKSGMSIARSSYSISTGRLRGRLWAATLRFGKVRFGSKGDMCAAKGQICFNPESGQLGMSALGQKRTWDVTTLHRLVNRPTYRTDDAVCGQ
jgi:hypothetical protein